MKSKKILSILLSVVLIAGTATTYYAANVFRGGNDTPLNKEKTHQLNMSKKIFDAIVEEGLSSTSEKPIELLVLSPLDLDISAKLKKAGAEKVVRVVEGAYKIVISANSAHRIAEISEIVSVGRNHTIMPEPSQVIPVADPQLEFSNKATTIRDLWNKGYTGKGTTIAIIDTGVEVNNELLKMTPDGKLKITDYQEFISAGTSENTPAEGDVKLTLFEAAGSNIAIPFFYYASDSSGKPLLDDRGRLVSKEGSKTVAVPSSLVGKSILGGVYSESRMITDYAEFFDTNNNKLIDDFAFICSDNNNDGQYEEILFDTDNDGKFDDEKNVGVYKDVANSLRDKQIFKIQNNEPILDSNSEPEVIEEYKAIYSRLFNTIKNTVTDENKPESKTRFNFAITRVENKLFGSWYANIAADTRGHGTHVAGDAAASGYISHDFVDKTIEPSGKLLGPAKDANIMALRVFGTRGGTQEDMYIRAMQYAAINGADVANMSLGSHPELTDGLGLGAQYADLLTAKYGTIYTMSNGNDGPGINSNGEPGDSWYALTVGAYCPSYYVVGDEFKNTENGMWVFSASGPTDDGRIKPEIVAPGSMISASPMWDIVGKNYDSEGTFKDQSNNPIVGYARTQGTSMAAPYVAGVSAALKQAVKDENLKYHPLLFKEAIMKSGDKTINNGKYNPVEIGNGMIDPLAAYKELKNMNASSKLPTLTTGQNPPTTWPYNTQDQSFKYKLWQDMYVVPNVLYKNDERMKWSNASGLFVRDGDIPTSVNVELTNGTEKDVNLNVNKLTYGNGQKTDWLTVQSSVSISKANKTTIKLEIDNTKLIDGVNVLQLVLDDPNTYQTDSVIPLVIINSNKLNFSSPTISQNNTTKPGDFNRQFVKVSDEVDTIRVSVEVPQGSKGRVSPSIYFPNGVKYVLEDSYPYVGMMKDGSFIAKKDFIISKDKLRRDSMDLSKPNQNSQWKWEGTWEIDTYCSYGSNASVDSTLKVSINGAVLENTSQYIDLGAGNLFDGSFKLVNTDGKNLYPRSFGFVNKDKNMVKERIEGFGEFQSIERLFQVKEGEKNIMHRLVTTNPSYGEGARIWLFLYKAQVNNDGSYTLIKPMINKYINVQANGMENEMVTYNLEPGYYVYAIMGAIMDNGPVDFDIYSQVLNRSDAEEDTIRMEAPEMIENGKAAEVRYTATAPVEAGKYLAGIVFEDENGKTVNTYNIHANVSATNKVMTFKQDRVPLLNEDVVVNVDLSIPGIVTDRDKLYGVDFELKYDPKEISAKEVLKGEVFTDSNSYKVYVEVQKDAEGKETGTIKYAYVFKGLSVNGVSQGNIAKIKFNAKKMGSTKFEVVKLTVGNYDGEALAVRTEKQDILTATPDINRDGVVDMKDYSRCAYSYKSQAGEERYRADADVNRDGKIDDTDLNYIMTSFNSRF